LGENRLVRFIFDVDGTLTPSRRSIDTEFQRFFLDFIYANQVYLVTGSDSDKTIEQLGQDIFNQVARVYNCNGNDTWERGVNTYTNEWIIPHNAKSWLTEKLEESSFPLRTGNHIEERPGMVNFSIVGRNATMGERKLYVQYDQKDNERSLIAKLFNKEFPTLQATVGGDTGFDIAPIGLDKSQIMKDFNKDDQIYFFGDMMEPGGNDYPLAIKVSDPIQVSDWKETKEYLEKFQKSGIAI
jgi:phosphomannomutase